MLFSILSLRNPKSAAQLVFGGTTTRPSSSKLHFFATSTTTAAAEAAAAAAAAAAVKKKPPRVVVLGSGWAGFNLALHMSRDVPFTCVSPRNHFIFTPLLPSAAVGTLECRCIQEPIRTVLDPKNGQYLQAKARSVDPVNKIVQCESVDNLMFNLEYDKLVIAVGVKTNTFGIESIAKGKEAGESIFFLKQLEHARAIRSNIIACFEKASIPTVTDEERRRLLSFLVVGGGPTSCEFTAEVHDFVRQDVKRLYSDLLPFVKITLVEAGPALLGPFDRALQEYAHGLFVKRDIDVLLGTAVTGVEDITDKKDYRFLAGAKRALLSDGTTLEFGTMVWSAGLAPRTFTTNLNADIFPKHPRNKRLLVDEFLRVKGHEGTIWSIGDAAINETGVPMPQLAQVARQQGIYMAKVLSGKQKVDEKPFRFFSFGSMAHMGEWKGIWDGSSAGPLRDPNDKKEPSAAGKKSWVLPPALKGLSALMLWRFAYWGRQTSLVNKILIPMHWFKTFVFGRDTSRY